MKPDKTVLVTIPVPARFYLSCHFAAKAREMELKNYLYGLTSGMHVLVNEMIGHLDRDVLMAGAMCLWDRGFEPPVIAKSLGITFEEAEKLITVLQKGFWRERKEPEEQPTLQSEKLTSSDPDELYSSVCHRIRLKKGTGLETVFHSLWVYDMTVKDRKAQKMGINSIDGHVGAIRKKLAPFNVSIISIDGCYAIPKADKDILRKLGEKQ